MAWKKVQGIILHPGDAPFVVGPSHSGGLISVTVEEDVSECCEKWRGKELAALGAEGAITVLVHTYPIHCPECGKRL